ncbi:MAG: isopentenyl-diphosphate Delta-isomerase [Thermoproteota archaeon]|nr:isopentenyl-diphosphate Delta-isomerase [Thermoproteota archaeon]
MLLEPRLGWSRVILAKIEDRKAEHIRICMEKNVQARMTKTGFEDISFIHRALPEISLEDINTSMEFFGHRLEAPIVIEAITGGTEDAFKINAALSEAAESLGLAMGVGSQRAALEKSKLSSTFQVVRKKAPHAFIIGNIGAPQIVGRSDISEIKKAIEMVDADALAIHLNPLQESIQPEGNTSFKGVLERIEKITSALTIPIIVKETGAGISFQDAQLLEKVGVKGIDVSGAGGTSWAAVEYYRSEIHGNLVNKRLGETFWDWGIPTAVSVIEVRAATKIIVIASGGIRTGIEVAKAVSLGAEASGLASPLLKQAVEGNVEEELQVLIREFKTAMFLVGANSIEALKRKSLVITGKTAEWLRNRGFRPEEYAYRGED